MSSASTRSNLGRFTPITPSNHVQVSPNIPNAPLHPIYPGDHVHPPQAGSALKGLDPVLEKLVTESGHGSYISDLSHMGIRSVRELIRFAIESIPPSLGVSPFPSREIPQSTFASMGGSSSEFSHSDHVPAGTARESARRRPKEKLYEVEGTALCLHSFNALIQWTHIP